MLVGFLLTFVFSSCSKRTEYTHAIPKNISTIASFNLKSLFEKSGISDKDNVSLKQHITDALRNGLNEETSDRLMTIIEKPSKSGFDLKKPVYLYVSKDFNDFPVVDISVDDKSDLTSTLEALAKSNICTVPEETKNYNYSVVNNRLVIAYNKGTALFIQSSQGASDQLLLTIDKIMTQKKEESFCSIALYDSLDNRKDDICFYESLSKASFLGNINFKNGSVVMQIDKIKDKKNDAVEMTQPITNVLLDRFPKSMPFILSMGIKGLQPGLLSALGLDELDSPIIKKLTEIIKGDVTIGINVWNGKKISFLALAEVKDDVAKTIGEKSKDIKKLGTDDYAYSFLGSYLYFGLRGKLLYVTNNVQLTSFKVSGDTYAQNSFAVQAKGKRLFFMADPTAISRMVGQSKGISMVSFAQNIECIYGYDVSPWSWQVKMMMKNKNVNALKQIIGMIRQMVGM